MGAASAYLLLVVAMLSWSGNMIVGRALAGTVSDLIVDLGGRDRMGNGSSVGGVVSALLGGDETARRVAIRVLVGRKRDAAHLREEEDGNCNFLHSTFLLRVSKPGSWFTAGGCAD